LQYWGDNAVKAAIPVLVWIASYFAPPNVSPLDLEARAIRQITERLIGNLLLFNSVWCGATTGAFDCTISSDGIVPTTSQFFPGDARNFGYYGPAHVDQTSQSEPMIHDALVGVMNFQPRGAGGGGDGGGGGGGGGGDTPSTLSPGERLYPDTEVRSPNGQFALRYQSDGNLVLYGPAGAIWDSGTAGRGGGRAEMQVDGNLVVYPADGGDPWESGTAGMAGAELRVQDDGYIVIYDLAQNVPWYAPQ
jgi:hypothetical protein